MAHIPGSPRSGFIEFTKTEHDHGGPGWEFGTCLWSPSRGKDGADFYPLMRQVEAGDLIIHFLDRKLVGYSRAAKSYEEVAEAPPNPGPWADMSPYYRIELEDYNEFPDPVPTELIFQAFVEEIVGELAAGTPSYYPFNTGKMGLAWNQGMYLTVLTPSLFSIFSQLSGMPPDAVSEAKGDYSGREEFAEGKRRVREVAYFARHPELAKAAKEKHGYVCQICGFDYAEAYGDLGEGYIEVHHLNPLSERAGTEEGELTTNLDEVIVVCASCHRMLHRKRPALTPEELQEKRTK